MYDMCESRRLSCYATRSHAVVWRDGQQRLGLINAMGQVDIKYKVGVNKKGTLRGESSDRPSVIQWADRDELEESVAELGDTWTTEVTVNGRMLGWEQ